MNFQESVEYLYSLGNEVEAMKLGLDNIRTLLAALGNPEANYLKVQVAGTNGKGSVCAFLNSICLEAGIKTGLYTSPHLVSVTERMKIDGVDIGDRDFARLASRIRSESELLVESGDLENVPTYFEQVTAIALVAFAEANVELAILETGLGGRFDAVTAANAEICAITRIDYDHQKQLGETIEEIAAEKAAIIRSDSQVVLGKQRIDANQFLLDRCSTVGAQPVFAEEILTPIGDDSSHDKSIVFKVEKETWISGIGLAGRHQVENAKVAMQLARILRKRFGISTQQILSGLKKTRHSGRLEWIGNILLDGAHNIGGAIALAAYLDEFDSRPITMIFGAMRDKNVAKIAEVLWPIAERIILTSPKTPRALSADELYEVRPRNINALKLVKTNSAAEAVDIARTQTGNIGTILITGSLYLVGEAWELLTHRAESE